MSLQFRRGEELQRTGIIPAAGEPIWVTGTKKLYIGDGVSLGGVNILATSAGTGLAWDPATQTIRFSGLGTGIINVQADTNPTLGGNLILNSRNITGTGNISISGTVTATQFVGVQNAPTLTQNLSLNSRDITGTGNINIAGAVTASGTVTAGNINIAGAVTASGTVTAGNIFTAGSVTASGTVTAGNIFTAGTLRTNTGLGGALSLNNYNITGTGNINITGDITSSGTVTAGNLILDKTLTNSGTLIESNLGGASSTDWFTINTHHNDADAASAYFTRTRGTKISPSALTNGDSVFSFGFLGRTAGGLTVPAGAINVEVAGPVSTGVLPGKIVFWTTTSTGNFTRKLSIGPDGLQTTVAPSLVPGASAGQVDTGTISSWMKINFNGTDYAVPMYAIRP